jgi:hypothetical protein
MTGMQRIQITAMVLGCTVIAAPSHAYLDPGTGSIILQSILASVALAMGVLRLYWYRVKAFFSGGPAKSDVQNSSAPETKNET